MSGRLWDATPRMQRMFARDDKEGSSQEERDENCDEECGWAFAKGRIEGQQEVGRACVVTLVNVLFPNLAEAAQQKVDSMIHPERLRALVGHIAAAKDEDEASWLILPKEEAEARERLKVSRAFVEILIGTRFPSLMVLGYQKAESMTRSEDLCTLLIQIGIAPDEEDARHLLQAQEPS
jgi:hypothetical protein